MYLRVELKRARLTGKHELPASSKGMTFWRY